MVAPQWTRWGGVVLLLLVSTLILTVVDRKKNDMSARNQMAGVADSLMGEIGRYPVATLGFKSFAADVAWLSAIQSAGNRNMSNGDYEALAVLLESVTSLDPRFETPFLLGGLILANSPGHVPRAIEILKKGEHSFKDEWLMPFYQGYIRYFSLGDSVGGGNDLVRASKLPDAPRYLPLLASRILIEGNRPEGALAFLLEMEKQEKNPDQREAIRKRILAVVVERDIRFLESAVAIFRDKFGRVPARLNELVSSGIVDSLPTEPLGGRYQIGPNGSVCSDKVTERMKVFRKAG